MIEQCIREYFASLDASRKKRRTRSPSVSPECDKVQFAVANEDGVKVFYKALRRLRPTKKYVEKVVQEFGCALRDELARAVRQADPVI